MRRLAVAGVLVTLVLSGCGVLPGLTTESRQPETTEQQPTQSQPTEAVPTETPPTGPPTPTGPPPSTPTETPNPPDKRLITPTSVGGIRLGMTVAELGPYVKWEKNESCGNESYALTARLRADYPGLNINYMGKDGGGVEWILLKDTTEPYRTAEGARLGSTITQLKQFYGPALTPIDSQGAGSAYEYRVGQTSIVFSLWDSSTVGSILVRDTGSWPEPC